MSPEYNKTKQKSLYIYGMEDGPPASFLVKKSTDPKACEQEVEQTS